GLHGQQVRAGLDLRGDQAVEADLVADDVAEADRPGAEDHGPVPGREVVRLQRDQGGDVRQQAAERYGLPERYELPFDVDRARAVRRGPQLPGVTLRVLEHLPDEYGPPDGVHRAGDRRVHLGVEPRVQVGGVLRPDHQVGRWAEAGPDLRGQPLGGRRVVRGHGAGAEQRGQVPGVRHVALDRGHGRGGAAVRHRVQPQ